MTEETRRQRRSGLFAEEYDVRQRQLRGNLPQAFVHALLLECAVRLNDASADGPPHVLDEELVACCPTRRAAQGRGHPQQLEKRLSQTLGTQAWHESGLGAPADIDELQRKITRLEQQNVDLTASLEEARSDLEAARGANRDLTRALNQRA